MDLFNTRKISTLRRENDILRKSLNTTLYDNFKYIESRLDNQIEYFDNKSIKMKKKYLFYETLSIILSSSIPVVTVINPSSSNIYDILTAILGASITILSSIITLRCYNNEWIECRSVCESLKYNKYLFLNKCKPYDSENININKSLFITNCENIIFNDVSLWKNYSSSNNT